MIYIKTSINSLQKEVLSLSVESWIKIRQDYETTDTSYGKLSKKYGYSKDTIARRSRKEKWIKFKTAVKAIQKTAYELFREESEVKVLDLIRTEDETLARFQEVVDGEVPYQEIFKQIENLQGNLTIKIDGTVKGLVETGMLIGDKRRELRGELPLKDKKLIELKEKDLENRLNLDRERMAMERERTGLELERKRLEIEEKRLEVDLKKIEAEALR